MLYRSELIIMSHSLSPIGRYRAALAAKKKHAENNYQTQTATHIFGFWLKNGLVWSRAGVKIRFIGYVILCKIKGESHILSRKTKGKMNMLYILGKTSIEKKGFLSGIARIT